MRRGATIRAVGGLIALGALLAPSASISDVVAVKHTEGDVHGFLALTDSGARPLADGDLVQTVRGDEVTSRMTFRFHDGSVYDETVEFSQRRQFRLIRDHLVERGPSFPQPLDMVIDAAGGTVSVHYTENGERKEETAHLQLPPDLSNGIISTVLKNADPKAPPKRLSLVVATPKPRLVALEISVAGGDRFTTGGERRTATHFVLKPQIGGIKGLIAPLVGKQPPDGHVWTLTGNSPAFIRSEQQFYVDGPLWRIELVAPRWPVDTRSP